jgi:hypothetical protein
VAAYGAARLEMPLALTIGASALIYGLALYYLGEPMALSAIQRMQKTR